jgi:hypothetical protein
MSYERNSNLLNTWWIKIWVKDVLTGSLITSGSMEDLGFMVAMACLAADCRGEYGWIQANPETPFTHRYLAGRFNISDKHFEILLKKQIKEDRMVETDKGIFIKNMDFYQRVKGAKKSGDNGSKPKFTPDPISQVMQDLKNKKAAAKAVLTELPTVVDQLSEGGKMVVDRITGEVEPSRFDKENK